MCGVRDQRRARRTAGRPARREKRSVVRRILAQQRRPMAAVKVCVAEPWRKLACLRKFRLCAGGRAAGGRSEVAGQRRRACVGVAERAPHRADVESVPNQCLLVSRPHRRSWMVPPAVAGPGQCAKNLDRLYPLLTESAFVEYLRGIGEIRRRARTSACRWVPCERQHTTGYFSRPISRARRTASRRLVTSNLVRIAET